MTSTLGSPTVPSSQSWWQASPKSSSQDLRKAAAASENMPSRQPKSSGLKLLASAIGFKSKKPQPSLTIQQPPPATLPRRAHTSHGFGAAPVLSPSKSTSSTRTRVDSLGPQTPVDSPKRNSHQSLFTLSDSDPFAVRSGASAPPTPSQSSLYSVGSDNAMPEFAPVKVDEVYTNDRFSYSSTSSNSIYHGNVYLSPIDHGQKRLVPKKSTGSLHRQHSEQSERLTMGPAWNGLNRSRTQTLTRTTSSTTLTEKNRFSQPDPPLPPRPPMRARGMTDSGPLSPPRVDFYPADSPTSATAAQGSRVIVRKPSISRVGMPKCAPPAQELPPTPPLPLIPRNHEMPPEMARSGSSSGSIISTSSCLSPFASPIITDQLSAKKYLSPPPSNPSSPDLSTPSKASQGSLWSTPRTIKKALSHQSLRRNHSSVSSTDPPPPLPDTLSSPLRKQPSFNDPVFPVPPSTLPILRHTSSFGSPTSSPPKESPMIQEPKRVSSNTFGTPGRRRLFSVSSHKSQTIDDDTRSLASVRSDSNQTVGSVSFRSLGVPLSPTSMHSSWESARPQSASSNSPSLLLQEYTPQHILSPAEMEKLAAGLGDVGGKSATSSRRSSAQGSSGPGDSSPSEHLTTPISRKLSSTAISVKTARRESSQTNGTAALPPRPILKQSMSQNSLAALPRAASPPGFASLPPPPRRRPLRPSTRPSYPATPNDSSTDSLGFVPLPPAPRRMRPKASVEKILHRRSIARKPSFLDIDDDTDGESDGPQDDSMHGSFLDLARESFDSVRTEEPETY